MRIEGFAYNSFDAELVAQILSLYVAGAGYQAIAESGLPVSFASVQRIVDKAVANGTLLPEQKHASGMMPLARKRAAHYVQKFPAATPEQIARLASCSESTVYRAKQ